MLQNYVEMYDSNKPSWIGTIYNILRCLSIDPTQLSGNREESKKQTKIIHHIRSLLENLYQKQITLDLFNDQNHKQEGNKLRTYRKFKHTSSLEPYLLLFHNQNAKKYFTRIRTSAHNLNIEKGRHNHPHKIPLNERLCTNCNNHEIEDEFHTLIKCDAYNQARKTMTENLTAIFPTFRTLNDEAKFLFLMKANDFDLCKNLESFILNIAEIRGPL